MRIFRLPKRFELVGELGRGAMGAVYEAIDHERGSHVAIKLLPSKDPPAVARFKREFRSLQDLHHPNLVALGELFCEEGEWGFSMDLIEGVDFIDYVRPGGRSPADVAKDAPRKGDSAFLRKTGASRRGGTKDSGIRTSASGRPLPNPPGGYDEARLRDALIQLTQGLAALHAADKIHRDIKPSNIRVRADGHLFLLDFGLVLELSSEEYLTAQQNTLGTPGYMAPEQAGSGAVGTAADWYGVGSVLYEAVTGRLPFEGTVTQVMIAKQQRAAPRISALVPSVAPDLDDLCDHLLAMDPAKRPAGDAVLRTLRPAERLVAKSRANNTRSTAAPPLVGRTQQIELLNSAFRSVLAGQLATVVLEGESGTGKTYLARQFLERISIEHPKALIVVGRCYEKEAVPYNAWDGAIESLASQWRRFDEEYASALLPLHIGPLAQTFPALKRVPAVTRANSRKPAKLDPREIRSRAFSALREFAERASQHAPFILLLEDLQWADYDSLSLLAEVLREPSAPPFLFLTTVRPLKESKAVETALFAALPRSVQRCQIAQLAHPDAVELATQLLAHSNPDLVEHAEFIATEARGHALFISELTTHISQTGSTRIEGLSLEDALYSRVMQLNPEARSLLRVLSVATRPLPEVIALRAAELPSGDTARVLSALRAGHLTRAVRIEGIDWLETYHDRVRKAVFERTSAEERRLTFERIAFAFEGTPHADANILADFWKGAGDKERAGRYAREAGDRACEALAFDRAVGLYVSAVERPSCTAEEHHELLVLLGDTLAKAGRGKEAADVYERALDGASGFEVVELERKAGEQFLRTGHYHAGIEITKRLLAHLGIRWPQSGFEIVITFIALRLYLAVRGTNFVARPESQVARRELARVDVCTNIGMWFLMADTIRALVFQLHHLRLALAAREPRRMSVSISMQMGREGALNGGVTEAAIAKLRARLAKADALAEATGEPYEQAFAGVCAGIGLVSACKLREGLLRLENSERLLRDRCWGKTWEIVTLQLWVLRALYSLGEYAELVAVQSRALHETVDRRELYGTINLRLGYANFAWLVRDDPANAVNALADGLAETGSQGFILEQLYATFAQTNIALYRGELDAPVSSVERSWGRLMGSHLRLLPSARLMTSEFRARAHLAAAIGRESGRGAQLAQARKWTRNLARVPVLHAAPMGGFLRAQIALASGDESDAALSLQQVIPKLELVELHGYAAVARRALGKVIGGEGGAELVETGEESLRIRGVRNVPALCRCLAPGFAKLD